MRLLDSKVGTLNDAGILRLFEELRRVTGVNPSHYHDFFTLQFLQQCLHPNGAASKAIKIRRECIASVDDFDDFLLAKKVGKLEDEPYRLLREFTDSRRESLESYSGTAVYMFLNKMLCLLRSPTQSATSCSELEMPLPAS